MDCGKLARVLPQFQPQWTVRRGMQELLEAFRRHGLTAEQFLGDRYLRIKQILKLQTEGRLDASLRWTAASRRAPAEVAT